MTLDTGFASRLILAILNLLGLLELVLESHSALWLSVAHDYDSSFRIVSELYREASHGFWRLRDARLTVNVSVGQKGNLARCVGTWEVESCWAPFLTTI